MLDDTIAIQTSLIHYMHLPTQYEIQILGWLVGFLNHWQVNTINPTDLHVLLLLHGIVEELGVPDEFSLKVDGAFVEDAVELVILRLEDVVHKTLLQSWFQLVEEFTVPNNCVIVLEVLVEVVLHVREQFT